MLWPELPERLAEELAWVAEQWWLATALAQAWAAERLLLATALAQAQVAEQLLLAKVLARAQAAEQLLLVKVLAQARAAEQLWLAMEPVQARVTEQLWLATGLAVDDCVPGLARLDVLEELLGKALLVAFHHGCAATSGEHDRQARRVRK